MKNNYSLILLFPLLGFISCKTFQSPAVLYQRAIVNSMSPDSGKIYAGLVPISKENKNLVWKTINGEDYLQVVTWKQNVSFYQKYQDSIFYNTGNYEIWVTAAPELRQRMKAEKAKDPDKRLKELLGLPPNATYSYFVEFWGKPADLFRPCPDSETGDQACHLCFPANTSPEHITWIDQNRISRYYQCDLYSKYPWTQLGYTYDWNRKNKSHVGLSEFVIGKGKNIKVGKIYNTKEYLEPVK